MTQADQNTTVAIAPLARWRRRTARPAGGRASTAGGAARWAALLVIVAALAGAPNAGGADDAATTEGQSAAPSAPPTPSGESAASGGDSPVDEASAPAPTRPVAADELAAPQVGKRHPDAVEVYHASFETEEDENLDGWPDGWTRRRGPQHPGFLRIEIGERETPDGAHALGVSLNGGGAAVFSPPIPIGNLFSYVVECLVCTQNLRHDRAYVTMTMFDDEGHELDQFASGEVREARDWTKLRVGPAAPASEKASYAVIGLHVVPGETADLEGQVWFDDLWLGRLPQMTLSMNSPDHVYTNPGAVEVTCRVSGIFERDPLMTFEVVDVSSNRVASREHRLEGQEIVRNKSSKASALLGSNVVRPTGFAGTTRWKPELTDPGYYRVQVTMVGRTGQMLQRYASLAIVQPQPAAPRGEFGWSLPKGDNPLSLAALVRLLPNAGINWVKFPVWVSENDTKRLDDLVSFAERLTAQGIETVGVLADPPADVRPHFADTEILTAADIFSTEAELWYPLLEPIMTRLGLQVRWWQLGRDNDQSFVGYRDLVGHLTGVRKTLQRFGQEINLGIGWRVINEPPADERLPWQFLTLSGQPQLTKDELAGYLAVFDARRAQRWVSLQPLPRGQYALEVRATDLIQRMLAAKINGAEAIFVPDPINTEQGLMNDDGTPGELLLPWRTTALALGGAEYLGSLTMPQGSVNHLFARDGQVVMVAWNDRLVEEVIYLGDEVRQIDVWGHVSVPAREQNAHRVVIGPLPTFIAGISEPIVRWCMAVRFEKPQLPSVMGLAHENALVIKNFFSQGVGGQIRLHTPDVWKTFPRVYEYKMAAGEEQLQPFTVTLPLDASTGKQSVRIDFDINADRRYQFSVFRELEVGLGDVALTAVSHLNDHGDLEVEQYFDNKTDGEVSFKCLLFAPGRQRMISHVIRLKQDRDVKRYRFPNGRELLGQTLTLRAYEVNGQRILGYQFVAEE